MVNIKANTVNAVNQLIKQLIYNKSNFQIVINEWVNATCLKVGDYFIVIRGQGIRV